MPDFKYLIFLLRLGITSLLPKKLYDAYWNAECPECHLTREWHEYGVMRGVSFMDGPGPGPCKERKQP